MTASLWPDWRASLSDASASDWITVAAYLLVAVLAHRAARRTGPPRERVFWQLTAVAMLFLGINELFDLQMVLTAAGKAWALEQGWYEQRRLYQLEFIIALAIGAAVLGVVAIRFTRRAHRAVRVALLGLVFIGAFILVRAASFHHVDALLGMGPDAFNWGSIQEMIGIVIVGFAARRYVQRPNRRSPRRRAQG